MNTAKNTLIDDLGGFPNAGPEPTLQADSSLTKLIEPDQLSELVSLGILNPDHEVTPENP